MSTLHAVADFLNSVNVNAVNVYVERTAQACHCDTLTLYAIVAGLVCYVIARR